ncbi:MAG: CDP-diacylglycerol--glycerol-3-phosphate 3-phosphatidyltransferase [Candidatus Omnitrophica bacterium]|nr:CDP-diacylglycerol--glycerol-3-phosphate 3-phosphatidyltransferase [Candidatus Omnitrophota bacterium]
MNLPNILTVSRIFLTLVFAVFAQTPGLVAAGAAVGFFALAALTDLADGYLARKYGLVTTFGQIMDPVADKLLILTALFIFSFESIIPVWMAAVVASREILVTVARIQALTTGKVLPAESAGKVKAALQMTAVTLALLYRLASISESTKMFVSDNQVVLLFIINGVMLGAVLLTLWSGGVFFRNLFAKE